MTKIVTFLLSKREREEVFSRRFLRSIQTVIDTEKCHPGIIGHAELESEVSFDV